MKRALAISLTALALVSCNFVTSLVHEGELVAKAGSHELYSTELESYIPKGLSPEDSTSFAQQYINTWAMERLYEDMANRELSKSDLDVTKELDDYRRSLLKYRYEQSYVNQRLDTSISENQISDYFKSHQDQLRLTLPILKARYVTVLKDSPNLTKIRKELSVDDSQMMAADSVLFMSTLRNTDFGGSWVEAPVLAREFGTDYVTALSSMKGGYIETTDEAGNHNIAYVYELIKAGEVGPEEFYRERIKDIILGSRKQTLLNNLERDLLEEAREQGNYVIY